MQLKELEQRISSLKEKHTEKSFIAKKNIKSYRIALNILLELISGLIVGAGIGYMIDKYFNTGYVFSIIFIFIGFCSSILNMYKYLSKL